MIQRIQSIWLLLASICNFLIMKIPFFGGTINNLNTDLTATYKSLTLILTSACGVCSFVLIFFYKKRMRQFFFSLVILIVSLINIILLHKLTANFSYGHYTVFSAILFAIPIFLILASRAVYQDEKLVKSIDRLR